MTSAGCCFATRPVPAGSSAAVLQGLCRSDRPPAVFACSGPVQPALLACHLCHAMPTAPVHQPRSVLNCPPPPCSFPCAPGSARKQQFASCKNCPVGSYNAGLQWRLMRRFNFPHPISRAEIVPEAPFVARSGDTCRREVRAVDHIGGGSDSSRGRECNAGRRVQGSRSFYFSLGF